MNDYLFADTITGKRKILIVEDNEINREILKLLLSPDYYVYEAENGQEGIDLLQKNYREISLVLLDVEMPVMDGYGFLKLAKADPILRNIPVVITTGATSEEVEEKCLGMGATDFIRKPYRPGIILSRVKSLILLHESRAFISAIEYDELTGVYTKQAFYHHAANLLKANPDKQYSLIISDIDDFKSINEKYGEEYGNQILMKGASMLKPAMEHGIPIGRYGGDQFVSLMEETPELKKNDFLSGFLAEMEASFELKGLELRIGVYENVDHSLPVSVICDRALMAVRSIHHHYGKRIAFFDDSLRKKLEREQQIEADMKQAYDEGQFQVYYQPKHDSVTGKLVGAEALIRWIHPELGFMSPGEFIPLFEKNGFIVYADYYVWKRTCQNQRRWIDEGLPVVPISVNTSKYEYEYPNYMDMVLQPIKQYQIDPSLMHIEVTESLFSEHMEEMSQLLKNCRDAGFKIELDDFGSGYSSLNILGTLPLDVMKLDMSFMRQLNNPKRARILSSSINLARTLGLTTVAEGVEEEEQRELLKVLHCDSIQGFYFSKPMPEDEFAEYLRSYDKKTEESDDGKGDFTDDSGLYMIDDEYNIVRFNHIIHDLYPQMKEGEKCHKCLMGLDEPCDICPVKNKVRGPQTYLDPLRNVYETVQVAKMPLPDGRNGYAIVLYTLR